MERHDSSIDDRRGLKVDNNAELSYSIGTKAINLKTNIDNAKIIDKFLEERLSENVCEVLNIDELCHNKRISFSCRLEMAWFDATVILKEGLSGGRIKYDDGDKGTLDDLKDEKWRIMHNRTSVYHLKIPVSDSIEKEYIEIIEISKRHSRIETVVCHGIEEIMGTDILKNQPKHWISDVIIEQFSLSLIQSFNIDNFRFFPFVGLICDVKFKCKCRDEERHIGKMDS